MRALLLLALLAPFAAPAGKARLRELAALQGVRDNELFGYGLVVGLSGTGDTEQVLFTHQSLSGMLGRLGIRVDARDVRSRNVAAVMVTARLPTYARPGSRLDVTVASLGNARSLSGGVLLFTPLAAGDGEVYAVAQGALQVGGFEAQALGASVRRNQTTTGRVPQGASVERAFSPPLSKGPWLLGLKRPDASTAVKVARAIESKLGQGTAKALDPASVEVTPPEPFAGQPLLLLAELDALEVDVDPRARVVINERTGTVVAGENVRLRPATVAHGGLQVTVATKAQVSQPAPLSAGATVAVRTAELEARDQAARAVGLEGTGTVAELTRALDALGVTPRELISILQALHAAGALDADLEVL